MLAGLVALLVALPAVSVIAVPAPAQVVRVVVGLAGSREIAFEVLSKLGASAC